MNQANLNLAEQFDDPQQQSSAASLGMWTFLATEILFFGVLFLVYTAYRHAYPVNLSLLRRIQSCYRHHQYSGFACKQLLHGVGCSLRAVGQA